jgi:hypothetical protein
MRWRVEWINLTQGKDKWLVTLNMDTNRRAPYYVVVPPHQLIQYTRFQLTTVYRCPKQNCKFKEINGS